MIYDTNMTAIKECNRFYEINSKVISILNDRLIKIDLRSKQNNLGILS